MNEVNLLVLIPAEMQWRQARLHFVSADAEFLKLVTLVKKF